MTDSANNPPVAQAPPGAASVAPPSDDPTDLALARLASTRRRLLQTLAPHQSGSGSHERSLTSGFPRRWLALGRLLLSRGPSAALLRAVKSTARQWWHAQPWAGTAGMLGHAVAQEVTPVVRRHPWLTVGAALVLGAAAVPARHWLWRTVRPHAASIGRRAIRTAWNVLTQAPVQLALTAALAAWIGDQKGQAASESGQPKAPTA